MRVPLEHSRTAFDDEAGVGGDCSPQVRKYRAQELKKAKFALKQAQAPRSEKQEEYITTMQQGADLVRCLCTWILFFREHREGAKTQRRSWLSSTFAPPNSPAAYWFTCLSVSHLLRDPLSAERASCRATVRGILTPGAHLSHHPPHPLGLSHYRWNGWAAYIWFFFPFQNLGSELGSLLADEATEDPMLAKLKARSSMLEMALQVRAYDRV